jgi:hypothetical protein
MNTLTVNVKTELPLTRVADLLCSALEGGSNYWYSIEEFIKPEKINFDLFKNDSILGGPEVFRHIHYPVSPGGALIIVDKEEEDKDNRVKHRLDLNSLERGAQIFAEKYPRHFADFMNENDDAITGDVFLQCCLFGEIVYA